jgi:hypothetical protein
MHRDCGQGIHSQEHSTQCQPNHPRGVASFTAEIFERVMARRSFIAATLEGDVVLAERIIRSRAWFHVSDLAK